jgi:hypothetical protein
MIDFWCSTVVHLSLEKYYNSGLTPEECKEIIEGINDPVDHAPLHCIPGESTGIIVETRAGEWDINYLVHCIDFRLAQELRKKNEPHAGTVGTK